MGSNPIPSIEFSVRCPTSSTENLFLGIRHQASDPKYEMRDLYNRKVKLERWIQRIHLELQDNEDDKKDILKFVAYLQEKDKSIFWIVRCITALLQLKKEIKKPFSQVTKEDIKKLFEWMNDKEYRASTHEKFRVILKIFYKVVYGNNEIYPDCVKWFSVTVGKEIKSKEKSLEKKCDQLEIITKPATLSFHSVSQYYKDFKPIDDEQVLEILKSGIIRKNISGNTLYNCVK